MPLLESGIRGTFHAKYSNFQKKKKAVQALGDWVSPAQRVNSLPKHLLCREYLQDLPFAISPTI